MSQRRTGRSSRNSQSQYSQQYSEDSENSQNIVNDIVRYIIYKIGNNMPITRSELMQNLPRGIRSNDIINSVNEILRNTYGYELLSVEPIRKGVVTYIVSNKLPFISIDDNEKDQDISSEDSEKVLLLLILSHIFMSNNSVSDVSLYNFLNRLGIDTESKHPVFGIIKDYVNKDLVKKLYLRVDEDEHGTKKIFSWGSRSEVEISKMKILKFISKIYKNKPKDWLSQYEEAEDQFSD